MPQGQEQLAADPLEAPVAIGTYVWLLGVMGMAVKQGNEVTVTAEGDDEDAAIAALEAFFNANL